MKVKQNAITRFVGRKKSSDSAQTASDIRPSGGRGGRRQTGVVPGVGREAFEDGQDGLGHPRARAPPPIRKPTTPDVPLLPADERLRSRNYICLRNTHKQNYTGFDNDGDELNVKHDRAQNDTPSMSFAQTKIFLCTLMWS